MLAAVAAGSVLLRVDAIYGAGIYAGGVFGPMQGSAITYHSHLPYHHLTVRSREHSSTARGKLVRMAPTIEKLSAVTFRVANMTESVRFYRDVLGMKLLYGGEGTSFSSLRSENLQSAILNLEQGEPMTRWGRLIFHVTDVDALWTHLKESGFNPDTPRDASWGERFFHMPDPDGHELSFARPLP